MLLLTVLFRQFRLFCHSPPPRLTHCPMQSRFHSSWCLLRQHPTARHQNLYAFYPIINKADRFSARNNTSVLSHSSVGQKVNAGLTGTKSRDGQGWFPGSMAPDSPPPPSQPPTSGVPFMLQISPAPSPVVYPSFSDHGQKRLSAFKHSSSYLLPMWITQAHLLILKVLNLNHIFRVLSAM